MQACGSSPGSVAEAPASWSPLFFCEFLSVRTPVHQKKRVRVVHIERKNGTFKKKKAPTQYFSRCIFLELPLEEAQTVTSVQNLKQS